METLNSLSKKLGIKGLNDLYKYIVEGYIESIERSKILIMIKKRIEEKTIKYKKNLCHKKYYGLYKEYRKKWNKDHPEYNKQYLSKKYKTELKYNLNHKIGIEIRQSLKGNKAGHHWENLVDYILADLKKRLNKTMPEGYTWQDFLTGELHIDHKIPISAFNFTMSEHTDFKRCWALSNLRLLPAKENLIKHNNIDRPFQPALRI